MVACLGNRYDIGVRVLGLGLYVHNSSLASSKMSLSRLIRVIGINIGKGSQTPLEEADKDYKSLMQTFYPHADYLAVNISSPNTIGLRRLQARDQLEKFLDFDCGENSADMVNTRWI